MLTKSGVKLLDFGLAKLGPKHSSIAARSLVTAQSGPVSPNLTAEGTIIGTLQYMAPEQLEGLEADARSDIFAFGAVLYEMVTGRRAFQGKSQPSLISAIMSQDPPTLTSLQPFAPLSLDRIVKHCLAKDRDARWQMMHDVLLLLNQALDTDPAAVAKRSTILMATKYERVAWIAVVLLLLIFAVRQWRNQPTASSSTVAAPTLLSILPPENLRFAGGSVPSVPVISPNGRRVVLTVTGEDGETSLWVRALDAAKPTQLADTIDGHNPFWSPDSRFIGFFANGKLKKVQATGGPVQTLCDSDWGFAGAWSTQGVILFSPNNSTGLLRVSSESGVPTVVTVPDYAKNEVTDTDVSFLPDGRHFLYATFTGVDWDFKIGSLDSGKSRRLPLKGRGGGRSGAPQYTDGYIIYKQYPSTLMAQAFDAARLEISGEPQVLAQQVEGFSVADNRMLALRTADEFSKTELVWLSRTGEVLAKVGTAAEYGNPSLSPDGQRVAVARQDGPNVDVWILDTADGHASRLTSDPLNDNCPVWSSDGKQIIFCSNRGGRFVSYIVDSRGGAERLLPQDPGRPQFPSHRSKDLLAYGLQGGPTGLDSYVVSLDNPGKAIAIANGPSREYGAQLTFDGKFIAYYSDESGKREVYVQPFPPNGTKVRISQHGWFPRWRRDGKEIFYLRPDGALMAVDMKLGEAIDHGRPHLLFKSDAVGWLTEVLTQYYDVTADGQKFLVSLPAQKTSSSFHVMLDWAAALKH